MSLPLSILIVPAFDDNYLWILHNGRDAAVVDPGEANAIVLALNQHGLQLRAILLTHHHDDHIGGVPALVAQFGVPVFGPAHDGIAGIDSALNDGDVVELPALALQLKVIAVPGHTLGHIAYYAPSLNALFCGDTLFAGGCGRLFEGSPAQMLDSLDKLAALPAETAVYCAHEYTLPNLRFALAVEPNNTALLERIACEQKKRDVGLPTVPSSIALERATNPFLRSREPEIRASLMAAGKIDAAQDDVAYFGALRAWKNVFR